MTRQRIVSGPGRESVWDYPRPPRLEASSRLVRVEFAGQVVAETTGAYRVLETSHPPVFYVPPYDVDVKCLKAEKQRSFCEWKGLARYWSLKVGTRTSQTAAWSYPDPTAEFVPIKDFVAFYPWATDGCFVDGERVRPQPGRYYGGWITDNIIGPFKGEPGSEFW